MTRTTVQAAACISALGGVVVVDKPAGITSHDVVNRLRRIYNTRRVGHAGTLDPMATGVLVVCIGQATRVLEYLATTRKAYTAGVEFGIRTDSQDITGAELSRCDTSHLRREEVEAVLSTFRGSIRQIPPMHSAVHHEGKRLYELARKGVEVDREAREVEIYRLVLLEFSPGSPAHATLEVACSSGTYIRTLAADIGDAVGTGAVMDSLRRTSVGAFDIRGAYTLEQLADHKDSGRLQETVRPITEALAGWPRISLTPEECVLVRQGRQLPVRPGSLEGNTLLTDEGGSPVALAAAAGSSLAPFKVFAVEE